MSGEGGSPAESGKNSATGGAAGVEDVSKLLPLSVLRSQLVPSAPNRRQSAIDFLYDFGGSSWIAYGASSLLVISYFPSPFSQNENLVGPFFRQVIQPPSCRTVDGPTPVNAVSWCPVRPSGGEIAAALGNSIWLYEPRPENNTGSLCWKQTAGIVQSSMVEAIEWTGSGDGLIAAGQDVSCYRRKAASWEIAWKWVANVPQVLLSATWSIEGPIATAACFLMKVGEDGKSSPTLSKEDYREVSVCYHDGKSGIMKTQLCHPQPVSMISWRPLKTRNVLLTCCLDGTVRLWGEIDNVRSRKVSKESNDHKMTRSFHVVSVIEIEQCLKGKLGINIFIDWAEDFGCEISKPLGECYSLFSSSTKHDLAHCEWLVSVGPMKLVTFWAIHCLDDTAPLRFPRVTLWKQLYPPVLQTCDSKSPHPEGRPILVKVVVLRNELFGPPFVCSLLQFLPDNLLDWWYFYSPSMDDADDKYLAQVSKERCLSQFAAGVINIDGHAANILKLAIHPYSYEIELAVTLDSKGVLIFWSLSSNTNFTSGMQMFFHPPWRILGKIRSQDLSNLKYSTLGWAPLVFDDRPLLLLGCADGIDCFMIEISEGETILCHKLFSVSVVGHNSQDSSLCHLFAAPLPSLPNEFFLYGVWMKKFQSMCWKVAVQSDDFSGENVLNNSASKIAVLVENGHSGIISSGRRYSASTYASLWSFTDSEKTSKIICFSIITLDHSLNFVAQVEASIDDSRATSFRCLMATGCSDGTLQLWQAPSAESTYSELEFIPWVLVGQFIAHDGPVNAVSLSNCCGKIATVCTGENGNTTVLHIWMPVYLIGGGNFVLEGIVSFNEPVVSLKWFTVGNGMLLLGVCMPNEFRIYSEKRSDNLLIELDKPKPVDAWCCIALSHICAPCSEFLWGPKLTTVLIHEKQFSVYSEWLSKAACKDHEDISHLCDATTDNNLCSGLFTRINVDGAKVLVQYDRKEHGNSSVFYYRNLVQKEDSHARNRCYNLADIMNRLFGSFELYHPKALLQNLYSGNWKRAFVVVKHLADSLKSSEASTTTSKCFNSGMHHNIPYICLSQYLEGTPPAYPVKNILQWGQETSFGSYTFQKSAFQNGEENFKSEACQEFPWTTRTSEIKEFIDTLEKSYGLLALANIDSIEIMTILDILVEISDTSHNSLYETLDEPGRRFWVTMRFQHLHFLRKMGRVAAVEELAVDSRIVAWAFHSDCQDSLSNSILSTDPSWLEMRSFGMGFWFTNVLQLRPRIEKLARLQYLKRKDPKDSALLYLALNRLQVLAGLFKISKDDKDKILFGFLSRNFQEEKNKAAALKNAYVLMGRHQLELAVAFFLLGGDPSSAVTLCAKNLGDEQLALVICRLLEGFGGPLEKQLISNTLLPSAIEKGDRWLSSILEWTLGNYTQSIERLFGPSWCSGIDDNARACSRICHADPHVGRYCVILASKHSFKNAIGDYQASVLLKFATVMNIYSLNRFGFPLEAFECFAAAYAPVEGSDHGSSLHRETQANFHQLLNPFVATSSDWLLEDVAYHLESNFRLSLAMKYISDLLQELPGWKGRNLIFFSDLVKLDVSHDDQDESQVEEFRQKLKEAMLIFQRKYSLKLTDLVNMVMIFACNSGLLFLGYQLLQGIVFRGHEVGNQHHIDHPYVHLTVLGLLLKASKEYFCIYSRYVVRCHLTDSTLKLTSGRSLIAESYNDFSLFRRHPFLQSLRCSLRTIRPLLKFYDHLLVTEGLNLRFLLDFMEYIMYFSHTYFSRDVEWLIQMVCQIYCTSTQNHDSIEITAGELMNLLNHISKRNSCQTSNHPAENVQECLSKNAQNNANEYLILSIPEDEKWQLIGTSLWMLQNTFINQQLSKCLNTKKLGYKRSMTTQDGFPSDVARLIMASVEYVSSSLVKQLAFFLRVKASKVSPVATFDWLMESDQLKTSSLHHCASEGVCNLQQSSNEARQLYLENLWELSVKPKDICWRFLNERIYSFTYSGKNLPSSWKDFQKANLTEHESDVLDCRSERNVSNTVTNAMGSLSVRKFVSTDAILETRRRDSNPKLENAAFHKPKEIVKRTGELLEAICCNSVNEQKVAVASNKKGLLFFNWKMESVYKKQSMHIWSEADWPLDGWARSESTPVPISVSPAIGLGGKRGADLGLDGATIALGSLDGSGRNLTDGIGTSGLGWGEQMEFTESANRPATTAENVSSQTLSSHPSRPFFLVGSSNTHVYLWEFGKVRATATYGVLQAANEPPPYALASISSVKFDLCGHRFATAASDGSLCTWQLEFGGRSNVHPTESCVCFSYYASDIAYVAASGSILAAAGCSTNDVNVVVWDTLAPPATSRASLVCHEGGARSLSVFDNDVGTGSISPLIVTGGKNGDVGLHDFRYIATGKSKPQRQPSEQAAKSFSTRDTFNSVENANGMLWYIPKAHLGSITKIITIPHTSMFLTGGKDGDVKLWDAKRTELVFHWRRLHDRHTFLQPNSRTIGGVVRAAVTDIQVFPHGFLTCGGDGFVKVVQLK
ncbi:hypothetical protein AXF42_Ash010071 [Apostasia shenzhenica]|uniref:RAVE complex protein Rav1 C-terminal domain-containing protein n=1 Tax=Apostasia shenzhenica TaxID=1088818 RepID=A0A2I0ACR3_9ASPA|nr:hypothetical protein AXF42_Ash010071 [Apostasia shenzhenica]